MESPSKRFKTISPALDAQSDFVPLSTETGAAAGYGYEEASNRTFQAPREPRNFHDAHGRGGGRGGRHVDDRPKSKHALPGYEPWILVKTKLRRRFVHNVETKESFWFIPKEVMPGVIDFDRWETEQKEKVKNAKWAEEQLKEMRKESKVIEVNKAADAEGRSRRRRSESLQREDEAAMLAELAAQAEHDDEQDVKQVVQAVQHTEARYNSDSSYEEVEVTDSEGEEHDPEKASSGTHGQDAESAQQDPQEDKEAPVEFGEDDIAWQLEAMGEDYGLDPGEYGEGVDGEWDEGAEGLPFTDEDAANLFRDLLDDYRITPFTPWDKVVADESETSILNDDRYTVLPNMRARKEVFDDWAKDKAAQLKRERAVMEKQDPRIPYLTFLHDKATPKLYWPEFKRKFKREAEMNDRKISDKDREKIYRDYINRLKLPESTRKADLLDLLKSIPLKALNLDTRLEALPQQLLSHLHYISLPSSVRDTIIASHISHLQPAPKDGDLTDEQRIEDEKRREERRRREKAMAERERQVDQARRRAEKDELRAKRDLQGEERELERAMAVSNRGLRAQLLESGSVDRMETER